MANSERREINKQGKMFIPMNMTGSTDNENFMTVPKLIVLAGLIFGAIALFGKISGANLIVHIIVAIVYCIIAQFILRKVVFEEKYFFKMWNKVKSYKKPTPSIFWNISSISHTKLGDIAIFSDMKIGCFVRLEKDTIVGKIADHAEKHYDAWSDFYREVNLRNLSMVQLNIMEPAGKDGRIEDMANTASRCRNSAIRDLLEQEVGYIKEISRATLSESEYILIYDKSVTHLDTIVGDVSECIAKLLEGAYAEVSILKEKEFYQLPKNMNNVEYFDGIAAQINVYKSVNYKVKPIMIIDSIGFDNKSILKLEDKERNTITKLTSLVKDESLSFGEWTVQDALSGKLNVFNLKNKSSSVESDEAVRNDIKQQDIKEESSIKILKFKGKTKKELKRTVKNNNISDTESDEDEEDLLS